MNVTRTLGAVAAVALALGLGACAGGVQEKESGGHAPALKVADVAGRTVSFDAQPQRVLLAEGRALMATSILNKQDPAKNVVAIGADLHQAAPSFESALQQARPRVSTLPTIGSVAKGDVTVENMLSFKPDAVVMTLDQKEPAEKAGFLQKMDQAKLPYVFIDFRRKPLENTTKSMSTLGQIFGGKAVARASEFNKFYQAKVDDVSRRISREGDKPRTFLWRAAGLKDCCSTNANLNLGDVVTAAGGHNLGADLLRTPAGDVTPEKVVATQPDHIIATGGSWAKDPKKSESVPHVELGYNATDDVAQKTLAGLLKTPGFSLLKAPKDGKMHAVYHQFYDSPFNVFALEQFAAWQHPKQFKGVDPTKDFAKFHDDYLPFGYRGVFFVTLKK